MKTITIGKKKISQNGPVFFVGEIGINHNGSWETIRELIDLAVSCNLDAVKFQKRTPELCVPEAEKGVLRSTPWGSMTYLEYKKRLELGKRDYQKIDKYCRERGIIWFASVWDVPSVDFLKQFEAPCYKIPSAKLTDKELLLKVKSLKRPIILSTGMSTENEIRKAVKLLRGAKLILMHCNSAYPVEDEDLNLLYLKKMIRTYPDLIIGYSGHEKGISASLVAAVLGAKVIERHITIDRTMWGTDQAASVEFPGLRRLSRDLGKLPVWFGNGIKRVTKTEKEMKKKLRNIETL